MNTSKMMMALLGCLFWSSLLADDLPTVKVAVLSFGTVNWEIDVIRHHKLDEQHHYHLEVLPVTGKNAAAVALQGKAVDVIYSDWVWVNRQRHYGSPYVFSAVSSATGGVYVAEVSRYQHISDLIGERLGVAGGAVDKSWLILQAYYKRHYGKELAAQVEPVFAAPPLLNKLIADHRLSAVLNYWHYSARLKAMGFKSLIDVSQALKEMGFPSGLPVVGWVFSESWANHNPRAINGFLHSSAAARKILLESDAEWLRIKPLLKAETDAVFESLKQRYRQGVVQTLTDEHLEGLENLYALLALEGGESLTNGIRTLDASMFWQVLSSSNAEAPGHEMGGS